MANSPDMLWTLLALGKLGATAVPVNLAAKGELLPYFLTQSDSKYLVVDGEVSDRLLPLEETLGQLQGVVVRGEGVSRTVRGRATVPFGELLAAPETLPPEEVRCFEPHYILYTSGTTGPSKGVIACHAQGFYVYGATQFAALGAMTNIIWKQPPRPDDADNPVRLCFSIPAPGEFIEAFERRFSLKVVTWFSMTENYPITLYAPGDPPDKLASAGRPRGEAEVLVVDEHDVELPPGRIGELVFRPRDPWSVMLGYYKMPEATLATNRNLWFHTGDRAYFDEEGWLWFVDRMKDSIRRRGENISAYELEVILAKHEAIQAVAAIPVPAEMGEDEVMVYIVARPGHRLTPEDVIAFCQPRMPYFMVPRYVEFLDELPKTPTEKVEKYKLRARAVAELDRVWDRERAGLQVSR
ncbi:MAG: AMP-binding protein [Candidatus Rokubacteria bacterium]|nr:AMP-binding protein [Candidatus Rokubacteria bacterium]